MGGEEGKHYPFAVQDSCTMHHYCVCEGWCKTLELGNGPANGSCIEISHLGLIAVPTSQSW